MTEPADSLTLPAQQEQEPPRTLTMRYLSEVADRIIETNGCAAHDWLVGVAQHIKACHATSPLLDGWQPIESAPTDGKNVLVCKWPLRGAKPEEAFDIFVHRAAWWAAENDGTGAWIVYNNMVRDPECHFTPTHWMHLPAPPAELGTMGKSTDNLTAPTD